MHKWQPLLTRIVANPSTLKQTAPITANQCKFTDVPDWAKVYVGYCAANHLIAGYGMACMAPMTRSLLLRPAPLCCGAWAMLTWNGATQTACQTAVALGLAPADALAGTKDLPRQYGCTDLPHYGEDGL